MPPPLQLSVYARRGADVPRTVVLAYGMHQPHNYIEQTLAAFSNWDDVFKSVRATLKAGAGYKTVLEKVHAYFNLIRPARRWRQVLGLSMLLSTWQPGR